MTFVMLGMQSPSCLASCTHWIWATQKTEVYFWGSAKTCDVTECNQPLKKGTSAKKLTVWMKSQSMWNIDTVKHSSRSSIALLSLVLWFVVGYFCLSTVHNNGLFWSVASRWAWKCKPIMATSAALRIIIWENDFSSAFGNDFLLVKGNFRYLAHWAPFLGCLGWNCGWHKNVYYWSCLGYLAHLEPTLPASEWRAMGIHKPVPKTTLNP